MSPVLPTPVSPMNTMFSASGMKSSSASVRVWRSRTPVWAWNGDVWSAQASGSCARVSRASSAAGCHARHPARSSCASTVASGVPSRSAAARNSLSLRATVVNFRFTSSCSSSSVVIGRLRRRELKRQHEVLVRDALEHYLLEPLEIEEPVLLGGCKSGEERRARIVLEHGEQPPQRCPPVADLGLEPLHVLGHARLDPEQLLFLRRGLPAPLGALAAPRPMRGIGHAGIERTCQSRMRGDAARALVKLHPLECLAHLERAPDQPI